MKQKKTLVLALAIALVLNLALPVYAAVASPLESINKLSDFLFAAIRAIGIILILFGLLQLGLSLKSHDPSQRAQGILSLFGGLLVASAQEILNMIL